MSLNLDWKAAKSGLCGVKSSCRCCIDYVLNALNREMKRNNASPHDNASALLVVLVNAHLEDIIFCLNACIIHCLATDQETQ